MSDDENMPVATTGNGSVSVLTENQDPNGRAKINQENPTAADDDQDENALSAIDVENGASKFVSKTKLKVSIKNWHGVASWKWIANDDTCGICRVAFDGCCPDCKLPGDDCPLVWGACSHCFHLHCITKWLNAQQAQHLCPMCRQDWKFKES